MQKHILSNKIKELSLFINQIFKWSSFVISDGTQSYQILGKSKSIMLNHLILKKNIILGGHPLKKMQWRELAKTFSLKGEIKDLELEQNS